MPWTSSTGSVRGSVGSTSGSGGTESWPSSAGSAGPSATMAPVWHAHRKSAEASTKRKDKPLKGAPSNPEHRPRHHCFVTLTYRSVGSALPHRTNHRLVGGSRAHGAIVVAGGAFGVAIGVARLVAVAVGVHALGV